MRLISAAVFVILCWAYSPIGIRIGLHAYEPGQLALLRFLVASIFMAGVAAFIHISLPRVKDLPLLVMLGFFAVALHHVALNSGQRGVSAGAASVLAQSTPIFTALIAHFFLKEKVTLWRCVCVLSAMIGAVIVIVGDQGLETADARGGLILLAALSWSIYFVLQKHYSQRYSALTMVCYTVWSGTVLLCIYAPGLVSEIAQAPAPVNFAVVVLGIFPSALAYLAWAYVLAHIEVSRASATLYFVPPVAMLLAALILGERASIMVIVGGGVIMISVLALNMERRNSTPSIH